MYDNPSLQTAIWIYDLDFHRIIWANPAALSLWESDSIKELQTRDFQSGASTAVLDTLKKYQDSFCAGECFTELWQLLPKNIKKDVLCRFSGTRLEDGRMAMLVEGTPSKVFSQHIHGESVVMIATFDLNGNFLSGNPLFENEFGTGQPDFPDLLGTAEYFSTLKNSILKYQTHEADLLLKAQKGQTWYRVQLSMTNSPGDTSTLLCQLHNINNRKNRELALAKEVNTDALTGLFNRRGFREALQNMLHKQQSILLFYIDLDGFKMVNDSIGHSNGDYVLKEAANRLLSLNLNDSLSCRFGGDEFVIAIPNKINLPNEVADTLVKKLSEPYIDDAQNISSISASIGISCSPNHSLNAEQLIRYADIAMYKSKLAGKKRWTLFEEGMEIAPQRRLIVSRHLSNAIANKELSLHYQPIIDVQSRVISSFEALLRWHTPALGHVSPQELIETAESIGLIDEIENWVIAQAVSDLPKLRKKTKSGASMSINISSMHIVNQNLGNYILSCLKQHKLTVTDITIEITESTLLDGIDNEENPIEKLTNLGLGISIDDFGTGYSSLAYLHKIKADTVKIDKAFANEATHSEATLKAIQALITSLGMQSLLEGIETQEQAEAAKSAGIDLHQGYFYGRPQPMSGFD